MLDDEPGAEPILAVVRIDLAVWLVAAHLSQPIVADTEVVSDLMQHHSSHLELETISIAAVIPLERPTIDRDLVRRNCAVGAPASRQRKTLVEPKQGLTRRRLVLDNDGHIRHRCTELRWQRLDRLRHPLLELIVERGRPLLHEQSVATANPLNSPERSAARAP